jgi:hypothetical protein
MFKDFVPHARLSYSIDSDLIAIGNTTWQTKNITSVSIEQRSIQMRTAEPSYSKAKPIRKFRLGLLALAIAISWTWSLSFQHPSYVGWPLTIFLSLATWFVGHFSYQNKLNQWNERRTSVAKQRDVWGKLAEKTPDLFSLIIDSSSGKSVALTALEVELVKVVHSAILSAMRSGASATNGMIETIAIPSGTPDDLYEKYCDKEISHA